MNLNVHILLSMYSLILWMHFSHVSLFDFIVKMALLTFNFKYIEEDKKEVNYVLFVLHSS